MMGFSGSLRTLHLALAVAVATTGCFTVDMLFKVRPDGSGTVEMSSTIKKEFADGLAAMTGSAEGEEAAELFSKAQMEATGDKLGPGVQLERIEPFTDEEVKGVRAVYTFTDIGKLRADAMDAAPTQSGRAGDIPGLVLPTKDELRIEFGVE